MNAGVLAGLWWLASQSLVPGLRLGLIARTTVNYVVYHSHYRGNKGRMRERESEEYYAMDG